MEVSAARERAPGKNRSGHDGLQEGPRRDRRRPRQGGRLSAPEGLAAAAKKADRVAADGAVGAYVHPGGKIGVLVEINCETDFVARTTEFQALLKDIAMQVAAANPRYVRREEVSAEELEKEKVDLPAAGSGDGQAGKSHRQDRRRQDRAVLLRSLLAGAVLHQRSGQESHPDVVNEAIARLGENIQIRRFARYHLGEGARKRVEHSLRQPVMNNGAPRSTSASSSKSPAKSSPGR